MKRSRPDTAERKAITTEIQRVMAEHWNATNLRAPHIGRCTRPDLDDELIALYGQLRTIAEAK